MNRVILIIVIVLWFGSVFSQDKPSSIKSEGENVKVLFSKVISTNGSTRATAYPMSNKIITANGKIFVAWLDHVSDIQIKSYNISTKRWSETVFIGRGVDNHSGPAITMDQNGFIYTVFGPHHGLFQFRRTSRPFDISEWDSVEYFGVNGTYPSLICGPDDKLHCTYRGGPGPRRLMYQQRSPDGIWSEPLEIVHPGVDDGYTQYDNPLAISPDSTVHLGFHIYDVHPKSGKSIGYLRSTDNGKTWETAQGEKVELPVTPETPCFIEQGADLDMRFGNLAIDSNGQPWFSAFHNETKPRSLTLWHFNGQVWKSQGLLKVIQKHYPDWEILHSCITFDKDGTLYLVSTVQKTNAPTHWGHPTLEIILLTSNDNGVTFNIMPISKVDPKLPNWLPNIERPYGPFPIARPSFLFTHGGPGKGLTEGQATEVIFVRLGKY